MKAIEQWVAKLEQGTSAVTVRFVWADVDETADQAVVLQFPDGPPGNATLTVFRFAEPPGDGSGLSLTCEDHIAVTETESQPF
jgi:hypothetical protein